MEVEQWTGKKDGQGPVQKLRVVMPTVLQALDKKTTQLNQQQKSETTMTARKKNR